MKRLLALIASALLVTGCSAAEPRNLNALASLEAYYQQEISWQDCGEHLKCTEVLVPLDYSDFVKGSIKLAVNRFWAGANDPENLLFFNPGGPGASGFDFVKNSADSIGTEKLRNYYALIGFDPRGVQNSSAIHCLDSQALDKFFYEDDGTELGSEADISATKLKIKNFVAGCQANSSDLLGNVDTESAARDLDVMRAVIGQEKLDYLGFSYGTLLGTVYANFFPDRVGRFVLDGAVDPTQSSAASSLHQLIGFDSALKAYLISCVREGGCPFDADQASNLTRVANFLRSLEGNPLENSDEPDRPVTVWAVETGMMMALYSENYWTYLDTAFTDAFEQRDGTMFQRLADFYNDRDQSGKYVTNINEANIAISCLDAREDASDEAMAAQNERMLTASPTLGRYWQFGALLCADWPYPVKQTLQNYSAEGTPMIVVVGTTNDPATPYEQAVNLAHNVLSNGYLITYVGEGHTAYGGTSQCIDDAVDDFLINSTVPTSEPRC